MERQTAETADAAIRMRFVSVVWRLTGANAVITVLAVVTSPILARALGPSGRGELAAIFTVITLAPLISDLGLTAYLARERARKESLGLLLGSIVPVAIAASLLGVLAAFPVANLIGRGREDVELFVELGLLTLPISVFIQTLYGIVLGEQRWTLIVVVRVLCAALPAAAIVGLSLAGEVTVVTVSSAYLITSLIGNAPFLLALRRSRPWHFQWPIARASVTFGVKSWLTTVANTANVRLDQFLMAALVSSRQLGLYALAVTLSTISGSLIGAVANALFPRVAQGEAELAARACRIATLMVLLLNLAIAAVSPSLVPIVFGEDFSASVPMLFILLGAGVASLAGQVLSASLVAGDDPASAARAQVVGLTITVPALLVFLPAFGGLAAAWITLVSYLVTLIIALRASVKLFRLPAAAFMVVRASDLCWLRDRTLRRA